MSINSNHKKSIFKNIAISLFIRVRRSCSEIIDFYYFSRLLIFQLIQKGYTFYFLICIVRKIAEIKRATLLPYKKRENPFQESLFFVIPFNKTNVSIDEIIHNSFNNLKIIFNLENVIKLKVVHKVNNNLRRILIHNSNLSYQHCNFKCSSCFIELCRCCKYLRNDCIINFDDKFQIPIISNFTRKSKFCIYIINCTFCNSYYVGETTQTLEKRLDGHLSNIRCFIPFVKEASEVAVHFN